MQNHQSTLDLIRAEWAGDPGDTVGMVSKSRLVTEEEQAAKMQVNQPVHAWLAQHGPATVEEITAGLGLDQDAALVVALAVKTNEEIGLLVLHGEHRWGHPGSHRQPSKASAAFGLAPTDPDPFSAEEGEEEIARAQQLTGRVLAVFRDRPGQDLATIDVGQASGIPQEEAVALRICLDLLEDRGTIVESGDRHGSGTTWRLS